MAFCFSFPAIFVTIITTIVTGFFSFSLSLRVSWVFLNSCGFTCYFPTFCLLSWSASFHSLFFFFFDLWSTLLHIKKKDLPSKAVCERYVREAVFWWGQWNGPVLHDDFSVIVMDFFFSFFFSTTFFFSAFFHHFCLAARNLATEKAHVLFVKLNWRIVAVFRVTKNCLGRKAVNAQRLYSTDVNSLITEANNSKGKKKLLKMNLKKSDWPILIFFFSYSSHCVRCSFFVVVVFCWSTRCAIIPVLLRTRRKKHVFLCVCMLSTQTSYEVYLPPTPTPIRGEKKKQKERANK